MAFRITMYFLVSLALILCASVLAESSTTLTPGAFLASRGLTVIDADQGQPEGAQSEPFDYSFCFLTDSGETSSAAIVFSDSGKTYAALDMMAALSGQSPTAKTYAPAFLELCQTFDFQVLGYGLSNMDYVCAVNTEMLEKMLDSAPGYIPEHIYHDKAEFIDAIKALLGV